MSLFLIPLAVICLIGLQCSGKAFRRDYMSPASTTAVNGIFTVFVLIRHILTSSGYHGGGILDDLLTRYIALGQLIVVTFLFYSGYGIAESLKNKPGYARHMPKNRIGKTWLNLALALVPYIVLNLLTGEKMTVGQILLSLIGWDSVGNSNWFMFVILSLYILVWLAFLLCKNRMVLGTALTTVFTCGLIGGLLLAEKDSFWWNTAIFFPLGMWFSLVRPAAEKFVQRSNLVYASCFAAVCVLFAVTHLFFCKTQNVLLFIASGVFMMACIILALMKFTVNNKALQWLGKNLFGIYILQRLPMRVIEHFDLELNRWVYTLLVTVIAFALAFLFGKLTAIIERRLFCQKRT